MNAGRLRHPITIQTVTRTVLPSGLTEETSWADTYFLWASIEPISGRERFFADRVESDITHRIRCRWPGDPITSEMRVVYGSRTFDIESVINKEERDIEYELMCTEVLPCHA